MNEIQTKQNVYDILKERGYIEQATNEEEIRDLLDKEQVTFYIGFDPTADSLHVGHFIQIMVMMHMQRAGHRPIALFGGGTGMIGDPSGRTDMRKMLTKEQIDYNVKSFQKQMSRFIDFGDNAARMVDNGDWLLDLNYIEFLREVGAHFSVNRMLTAECFKSRLEKGLSFLEFNYMLMQSYDFLELYRRYNCKLELGGNDQWSNIIYGVDLVRRKEEAQVYGLTFKLLTNSAGKKMGKTESGALWLDAEKTSPYEFYQYWRNVDDADVEKCLALLTFLPMEEVKRLGALKDAAINEAKAVLAYEVTKLVHGEEAAKNAQEATAALFGNSADKSNIPSVTIQRNDITDDTTILDLLTLAGLIKSKSDGRRLVQEGGVYLNNERINAFDQKITLADFSDGAALLRKGKKIHQQVVLAD